MAIAAPAIEITLDSEGNDSPAANNWGVQDNFFKKWRKFIPAQYVSRKSIVKRKQAEDVLTAIFNAAGFDKINNQHAANFFWDTFFHNPSLYRALICVLFFREKEFIRMVNSEIALTNDLIDDINFTNDVGEMLSAAMWLRRRLARVFWGNHLWKGFDQHRFARFPFKPYDAQCLPSYIPNRLFIAAELMMNRLNYMDPKTYPNKAKTNEEIIELLVKSDLPLRNIDMRPDMYDKIGQPFSYDSCIVPETGSDNTDSNINTILLLVGGFFLAKKFL
jgi:hypothetical protein